MTNEEMRKKLLEPFPPESVHWRIRTKLGADHAYVLAYIDARDVMDRLDDVFGVGHWERKQRIQDGNHLCSIVIHFHDEDRNVWIDATVEDVAEPTDIEAQKGGASDSFKRAAVNLGIARVYYTLGDTKVKLENGYIPDYEKKRLRDEVLIPAYKKFAEEYGLDAAKWIMKSEQSNTAPVGDGVVQDYLFGKRQELYCKLTALCGAPAAASVIEKVASIIGKWAGLDIFNRVTYIQLLAAELDEALKAAGDETETKSKKKFKTDVGP